jgi:phage gp29-like protein
MSIPRLPEVREIVSESTLRQYQASGTSSLSLARAFAGTSDPSLIWQAMIGNYPEAFAYYADLEEKDDDIGALLATLKIAVLSRKRKVHAADDSAAAERVAEFVRAQLARIGDFHQVLHSLLDAPGYGLSMAEITYDVSDGQVGLAAIKDCPQECFAFAADRWQPQIGQLRFLANPYMLNGGELAPEQKFLIFTYNPRRRNRFGRPLLRRVFWPSWIKRNVLRFWLRYAEKGPGTAAVKYAPGATADEQQKALAAAEALIEKVAIAVPSNFELVEPLLTSARSQNPAVYETLVNRCELAIARGILGETLTSHGAEQGAGSYALGQVHKEMFHKREIELARSLEEIINHQLVRRLVMWNFGPDAPMPKWAINTTDAADLSVRVKLDQALQNMGLDLTENYIRKVYSIPAPAANDRILEPIAAAAPPAANPGPSFAESRPRTLDVEDVNRLASQFRIEVAELYRDRVLQLTKELSLNLARLQQPNFDDTDGASRQRQIDTVQSFMEGKRKEAFREGVARMAEARAMGYSDATAEMWPTHTAPGTALEIPVLSAGEVPTAGDYGEKGAITSADLDSIAESYNSDPNEAPVSIGPVECDSPAHGWVKFLKRNGDRVIAKVIQASDQLKAILLDPVGWRRISQFYKTVPLLLRSIAFRKK